MDYITGDTHRDFSRVETFCKRFDTTKDDTLIILGDAGINYFGGQKDLDLKNQLNKLPITLFCIHGNHERRPEPLGYEETVWNGGAVYVEPEFPGLLFAKDSEIYEFAGKQCVVIGGAYSVDKQYRLARNSGWWPDEQPSAKIKKQVGWRLETEKWKVDVVLSHTCPLKYEPTEVFIQGINQNLVDKSTEEWLDTIENRLNYRQWYCGHYHVDKTIDRLRFMFRDIQVFH